MDKRGRLDNEPPSKKLLVNERNSHKSVVSRNTLELLCRLSIRERKLGGRLSGSRTLFSFR